MEQENLRVDLFFLCEKINCGNFKVQVLDKIFLYVIVYRYKKQR
jgi:hypothetical protein